MRTAYRWLWEKPSILLAAIIIFTALTQTNPCSAETQNKTLTEVTSYNFTKGFYNVVKFYENSETDYWIMHENKIPYLNISYMAPTDGFLKITLHPITGAVPYIELNTGWETDGLTYMNPMLHNETSYMILTPPMVFSDSNTSRIVGGSLTVWEMYTWPNVSGLISYSFTASDEISFDLIVHPSNPRQGDKINLFTQCTNEINDTTWTLTGNTLHWVNKTEVLEINGLEAGDYVVLVEGYDEFNNLHMTQAIFNVKPAVIDPSASDIDFFTVNYPESVNIGDEVIITATIDYSTPNNTEVKCTILDSSGEICTETTYTLSDSGSKPFTYRYTAEKSGVDIYHLKLFYNSNGTWMELTEATASLSIMVNENPATSSIPGFNAISIITAIMISLYAVKKSKE